MNPGMPQSDIQGSQQNAQQNKSTDPGHKHRYKNAGLDSQEMRRRREEEGIQLRKQKREQQLFKRRNVTADDILQVSNQSEDTFSGTYFILINLVKTNHVLRCNLNCLRMTW